ncbi:MAG: hypothetical protein QXT26_07955, partial [Thermoproteota archaeon]
WYGASGGGVSYHNDNGTPANKSDDTWVTFTEADGLVDNYVWSITIDSSGRKWYGTNSGVSYHNDNGTPKDKSDDTWVTFTTADGLANDGVNFIAIDSSNKKWYGTDDGISFYTNHFNALTATPSAYSVYVGWSVIPNSNFPSNVTLVKIYRSLSREGDYELVYTSTCLSSCSWEDTDFLKGQTHYYWLSVVLQDGREYRDKLDKTWARPLSPVKPEFLFYSIDPPRSGDVGSYIDYPLVVEPVDNFRWSVYPSLRTGYSLPPQLSYEFFPDVFSCVTLPEYPDGPTCSYPSGRLRVYINGYPSSCENLSGEARCVIQLQASGYINGITEVIRYENVLLNVRNPSAPNKSFITHYFYPDPDVHRVETLESVEVRGYIYPNPKTCDAGNIIVTSKFTPPAGRGSPVNVTSVVNDDGWFSLEYRPPYAGVWNVLTSWAGSVSCGLSGSDTANQPQLSPPDLPVVKAHTTITLSNTANENTQAGDPVTVTAKINPNPGIRPVRIRVLNPDSSVNIDTIMNTNAGGEISLGFNAVSGYMRVEASWNGDDDFLGTSSEMIVPIATPIGMGIIVGGRSVSSLPQATIDNLISLAYKTLRRRNMSSSRIYLLRTDGSFFDADGDGNNDVDNSSTEGNLEYAIEIWAKDLVDIGTPPQCNTYAPYRTPLTIYLIGYGSLDGSESYFIMANNDRVYRNELQAYLNNLLTNIQNRYTSSGCSNPAPSEYPVNVIIETKYGGVFVPVVGNSARRIVLTSTGKNPTTGAWESIIPHLDSNGNISYSAYFFGGIDAGKYIGTAHSDANNQMLNKFSDQHPLIDADGDGVANEVNDELQASNERLEFRPSGDMQPLIEGVMGEQAIVQDSFPPNTSGKLWAIVVDREDSSYQLSVSAVVYPPEIARHEVPGVVALTPSSPKFSGVYNGFYGGGVYTVLYIATDTSGNSAIAKKSVVSVQDSVAPEDVASVSATWQPGYFHVTWPESSSPDRHGYILYVERNGSFYEQIDVGDVLSYDYYVSQSGNYRFTVK